MKNDNLKTEQAKDNIVLSDVIGSLPLAEILGLDQSYPLKDVLEQLIEAAEILLHKKNYDGHNYEEINVCVARAKYIVKMLGGNDR